MMELNCDETKVSIVTENAILMYLDLTEEDPDSVVKVPVKKIDVRHGDLSVPVGAERSKSCFDAEIIICSCLVPHHLGCVGCQVVRG